MPYNTFPAQFINWNSIPQEGKKDRKVPWDVFNNRELDHLNPANWRSFNDVQTTGFPMGFVLPRMNPANLPDHALFLLDLDDAIDPATGGAKGWAQEVLNMFPGAMVEISHSRTGFHVMGYCQPAKLIDRKHKFEHADSGKNKLEWYCDGRFVALGALETVQGDVNLDWTAVLQTLVPVREVVQVDELGNGPDPRWSGPESDDELFALMKANRAKEAPWPGQIAVADFFGEMGDFRVLAHGNYGKDASKLPPYDFDGSSADMALMNHLAYYTGGDVDRMERLFMRSVMGQRDKAQKRPSYVRDTANLAAGEAIAKGRVLQQKRTETIDEAKERMGAGMALAMDQPDILDGHYYVRDRDAILTPTGQLVSPAAFERGHFGSIKFVVDPTASTQTKQLGTALDAMTRNTHPGYEERWIVDTTTWEPAAAPNAKMQLPNGMSAVNTYRPGHKAEATPVVADFVEPFLHIIRSNFPDPADQHILLSWMAHNVQHPGRLIRWAPVLQGIQGCGKGSIHAALSYCLDFEHTLNSGYSNVGRPTTDNLAETFTGYAHRKLLVVVDEIGDHTKRELNSIAEKLKPYISDSVATYRMMRTDAFSENNRGNWIFTTNHLRAMLAVPGERRYAHFVSVLQTAEAREQCVPWTWFKEYNDWFEGGGNELIRGFLQAYQFDPLPSVAPVTTTTAIAMSEGEPDMVRVIRERVAANEPGFRNGFVSAAAIRAALIEENLTVPNGRWFGENMKRAGFTEEFRSSGVILEEAPFWDIIGKMPPAKCRIYHRPGEITPAHRPLDSYKVAQGWAV